MGSEHLKQQIIPVKVKTIEKQLKHWLTHALFPFIFHLLSIIFTDPNSHPNFTDKRVSVHHAGLGRAQRPLFTSSSS